jgi:hypothetical protein
MKVLAINGVVLSVQRGFSGVVSAHTSGDAVFVDDPLYFGASDKAGACTSTSVPAPPLGNAEFDVKVIRKGTSP